MKMLRELHTVEEWHTFKTQRSSASGVLLLKFSPRCPISRSVERTFETWYNSLPDTTDIVCAKIDVVNSRPLSQQIAEEVHVLHESPQAIWLTPDFRVQWHASHYAITRETLHAQLQQTIK